jgi:hypothetical protein
VDTVAGVLGRRWWLLVLALLVVTAAPLTFVALQPASYEATATIRTAADAPAAVGDLLGDARLALRSPRFLERVAVRAGLGADAVSRLADDLAAESGGDGLVLLRFAADDRDEATLTAAAAVEVLLADRRSRVDEAADAALEQAAAEVAELEEAAVAARTELLAFEGRNPSSATSPPSAAVEARRTRLTDAVTRADDALAAAEEALAETEAAGEDAVAAVASERLLDRPLPPEGERWPVVPIAAGLLVGGLALGALLALVAERRDHTVRHEVDVQEAAPGIPVLAVIDGS